MSELHKFLFNGLPVRGALVRITDSWQEILRRRAANRLTGAWPPVVVQLAGEMTAAGVLIQSSITFNGALVLQIFGDGPVKVAVTEVLSDLRLRSTATVSGPITPSPLGVPLSRMINVQGGGRCVITLDPAGRPPGQQPYQGVVPLVDERGRGLELLADIIEHYMLQSEQLQTALVLAADEHAACGLIIQRLPEQGGPSPSQLAQDSEDDDFRRIALLAKSITREELLTLDADTILHRLFWQEQLTRTAPLTGEHGPRFSCSCTHESMLALLRSLGEDQVRNVLREYGLVDVGCDFCGYQEHFSAVDVARLFTPAQVFSSGPPAMQ
jgi:molecular chaperone Hsp33